MSNTKFTKGVWVIKGTAPLSCAWTFDFQEMNLGFSIESCEFNANIALMEAAPEMYDMLKSLSEMMPMLDEQTHPQIEMDSVKHDIDNLLAKARGES